MTDQLKNVLIGLFITVAVTIAVCLVLFLKPNVGDGKTLLRVRFANIAGIATGTRVTLAGRPVGEVAKILEVPNARELQTDETGRVFLYELLLRIDSSVQLYNVDEIAIRTTGLMGERSIAILPKAQAFGKSLQRITTEVIYANSVDPLENSFTQVAKVASKLQMTVDHLDRWFTHNQDRLTTSVQSFDQTMQRIDSLLTTVENEELIPSLRTSLDLFANNLQSLRRSLEDDELLHKTANLVESLEESVAHFNADGADALHYLSQVARNVASGTGTVGRMINSEDFYLRLTSVMGKVETLMNDINHYGVLFQYDKSWQRGRTKRANILKSLETPGEFKAYFEGEVDAIQTAVGRLGELMERAGRSAEREKIFQSEAFKQDFGTLLRQVQGLTDSIRLYNEELMLK